MTLKNKEIVVDIIKHICFCLLIILTVVISNSLITMELAKIKAISVYEKQLPTFLLLRGIFYAYLLYIPYHLWKIIDGISVFLAQTTGYLATAQKK